MRKSSHGFFAFIFLPIFILRLYELTIQLSYEDILNRIQIKIF